MKAVSQKDKDLFEILFVLELANNHWGKLERGLKIISDHARVIRFNNVKAAISLYCAGGSPNAFNISCASSILLISVQYYFQFKKFVHNAVYIFN